MVHILYSLTYFDEADTDPDIIWQEGFEISWNEIKDYFVKIVQESSEDESLLS